MSLLHTIIVHIISSCIVIGFMRTASCFAAPIILFEDVEFRGITSTFQIGEPTCVNLLGKQNDFYSSVDTKGNCFLLCEHQNCRGKCEKVSGQVADLSAIDLNDRVSSLKLCISNQDRSSLNSTTSSRRRGKRSVFRHRFIGSRMSAVNTTTESSTRTEAHKNNNYELTVVLVMPSASGFTEQPNRLADVTHQNHLPVTNEQESFDSFPTSHPVSNSNSHLFNHLPVSIPSNATSSSRSTTGRIPQESTLNRTIKYRRKHISHHHHHHHRRRRRPLQQQQYQFRITQKIQELPSS